MPDASGQERPRIERLPETVINQIAAGEVIERPVAVVKELVENSIDAGAKAIEVEYRDGGKTYIRVEDDGIGMTPDEAVAAMERHATSKLRLTDDLLRIRSYGFRGEALPSIASVSRFLLRTRVADSTEGFELLYDGGILRHQRASGCPVGTRIEVSQLFSSVPARRKFLKTDLTEAQRIVHMMRQLALSQPHIGFKLLEGRRLVFHSPPCPDLESRIAEIYGKALVRELLPISTAVGDLKLSGWISRSGFGRSSRADMTTLVNQRPVDARAFSFAVTEAYHAFLPRGKYPAVVLNLELPPAWVDVNVHPAKREVRFRDEAHIRYFIIESLTELLRRSPDLNPPLLTRAEPVDSLAPAPGAAPTNAHSFSPDHQARSQPPPESQAASPEAPLPPPRPLAPASPGVNTAPGSPQIVPWTFLSVLSEEFGLYRLDRGTLLIVNRRAVLQRLLMSQLENRLANPSEPRQSLLQAYTFEVERGQEDELEKLLPFFENLGLSVEPFGKNFYRLTAVPAWLPGEAGLEMIEEALRQLREEDHLPPPLEMLRRLLLPWISRKAHQLVETGPDFWEKLPGRLLQCSTPHVSPFGKPTYLEISRGELFRRFAIED